jgi:hypothetical protein
MVIRLVVHTNPNRRDGSGLYRCNTMPANSLSSASLNTDQERVRSARASSQEQPGRLRVDPSLVLARQKIDGTAYRYFVELAAQPSQSLP